MCGRFTRGVESREIVAAFDIGVVTEVPGPSFNICPGQPVAAVAGSGPRKLGTVRWGLPAPSGTGRPVINARAETLAEKPMFKRLLGDRRCFVVADGFYEWQTDGGRKRPVYIYLRDRRPFGFAALWDNMAGGTPAAVIVTTRANPLIEAIHDRMPVILPPAAIDAWLDHRIREPAPLLDLLQPYPHDRMACHRVSARVNTPRHDDPGLIRMSLT